MDGWYSDNDSEVKMGRKGRENEPHNKRCKVANRLGREWLLEEMSLKIAVKLRYGESEYVTSKAW